VKLGIGLAAGVFALAAAPGAGANAYCSPSGDWCFSAARVHERVVLQLNAAAHYWRKIEICVTPPAGGPTCRPAPFRSLRRTDQARLIWASAFPYGGPGRYGVEFRADDGKLGKRVEFHARPILYTVTADSVYVRNKPRGYVIGTLRAGETMMVQRLARAKRKGLDWAFGPVGGQVGMWAGARCGWVQLSALKPGEPGQGGGCLGGLGEAQLFAAGSYKSHAGKGAVYPAQVVDCPDSTAYGNYDPATGQFATPYGHIPAGIKTYKKKLGGVKGFGWRYLTKDLRAVMLKDSTNPAGAPRWFFMRSECVQRLPGPAQ
jgi:hypothetical protein